MRQFVLMCALMGAIGLRAEEVVVEQSAPVVQSQLSFLTGTVTVGDKLATITLPDGLRYLENKGARFVLEDLCHNPPDPDVLGLIVPPAEAGDSSALSGMDWFIVVSYDAAGFVKDDDAQELKYDELLVQMQEAAKESNEARAKQGYATIELLGWAEPPHYDPVTHKIYWAKRFQFSGSPSPTLNYCVRILGRRGFLELNAVAGDKQLKTVADNAKEVLEKTEFVSGEGYKDFNESSDHVAAYGIGGLIAGGVLLKSGLLKLLIKPLIFGGLFLAALIGKFLSKKKDQA